jgi:5-methyltetrahydrofolate--homocysteine methyltransferase
VRIAPCYRGPTLHVRDASRCPGVVDRLMSDELRDALVEENRQKQQRLVDSFERHQLKLVPYEQARTRRARLIWDETTVARPGFVGSRVLTDYPLAEIVPYIDWSPFFMAWELKGKFPRILDDPRLGPAARELYEHARQMLDQIVSQGPLSAHAVYGFWPAASVEDDIVVYTDERRIEEQGRFHTLRQQWERQGQSDFLALADFIAPRDSGRHDYLGGFVLTAGRGVQELAARFESEHDDYHAILIKALADRLAEAFAELLHARVRREWGYEDNDAGKLEDLIAERYRGIRPAPGYPAQPDHTEKITLFQLLDASPRIGVHLTDTLAMDPAASICGLYFAHPQSRYFAVGRLTRDQVEHYARRKGIPVAEAEKWLRPNLGYE